MEPQKKKFKGNCKNIVYTDEQIKAKQDGQKNKNTIKTEERANRAFRRFLHDCGEVDLDYWNYDEPELDNYLSKFWFGARKSPDSDYESDQDDLEKTQLRYTANTMRNFRYSLNRILKGKGHQYDIIHENSLSFNKSQRAFLDSQKELKSLGKGEIKSAAEITEEGEYLHYNCFVIVYVLSTITPLIVESFKIKVAY